MKARNLMTCILLPMLTLVGWAADEEATHDFLFLTDEAYVQEEGEWQFGVSIGYWDRVADDDAGEDALQHSVSAALEIEYGITERLQIELELPYLSHKAEETTASGIGDAEVGSGYAIVRETDSLPAVTAGIEFSLPTGDEDRDMGAGAWGYEGFVAVSKHISDLFLHASISYGRTDDAIGEEGKVDESEIGYRLAVVRTLNEGINLIVELGGESEREVDAAGESETADTLYFVPGIQWECDAEWNLGLGIPVGLTDDSADWGGILKTQVEF